MSQYRMFCVQNLHTNSKPKLQLSLRITVLTWIGVIQIINTCKNDWNSRLIKNAQSLLSLFKSTCKAAFNLTQIKRIVFLQYHVGI